MAASALQDRSAFLPTSGAPRRQNPGSLPFSEISTAAPCGGSGAGGSCGRLPWLRPGSRVPLPAPARSDGWAPVSGLRTYLPRGEAAAAPDPGQVQSSAADAVTGPAPRAAPAALRGPRAAPTPWPPSSSRCLSLCRPSARCPCYSRSPRRAPPHSQGLLSLSPPLRETPPSQFPVPPPFAPHATSHRHLAPFPSSMRTHPRCLPQLSELPPLPLPFFPGSFASPGSGRPWEVLRLTWEEGAC